MDPDELLKEILEMSANLTSDDRDPWNVHDYAHWCHKMARKVQDLDTWLVRGGFKPKRWK